MNHLQENKDIVRRYFEMFNSGDFSTLGDIVSESYADRLEGQSAGIDGIRSYLEGLKVGFPDMSWTIEQVIAEGDRVAVMNRITGTHLHPFGGLEATGNRVDFTGFQFYRIAGGKLAEHWEVADFTRFQEQLAAKPVEAAFKQFQKTLAN